MLKQWKMLNSRIIVLTYDDGEEIYIKKEDFDRAFGAIISVSKEDVKRDFAIR